MRIGEGSSPLARGLLRRCGGRIQHSRIIPARAGFTASPWPASPWPPDHPRSRGVYVRVVFARSPAVGSSPLARGLPTGTTGCPLREADHPRSRGVYSRRVSAFLMANGSSPLARGLHGAAYSATSNGGIIPARAGFTYASYSRDRPPSDHPRSRGVYSAARSPLTRTRGSSPLARGLRDIISKQAMARGIIPARAGFTATVLVSEDLTWDHPRSRGVYHGHGRARPRQDGSSPLARGLRKIASGLAAAQGIIPARAGFTFADNEPIYDK